VASVESRQRKLPRVAIVAPFILAVLLSSAAGFAALGRIVSATAEPCYRASTITIHLSVLNTSGYPWGDAAHPAYILDNEGSWPPIHSTWMAYNLGIIPPGAQDDATFITYGDIKAPPDRGTQNWVDITVRVPDAPGSNNYVSIGTVRVPLVVEEWPDLVAFGFVMEMGGGPGDPVNIALRVTNMGPGPVVRASWVEVRLSSDTLFQRDKDPLMASQLVLPTMAPGESRDYFLTGQVPEGVGPGSWNVLVQCDVLNEVPESAPFGGENNNLDISPYPFIVLGFRTIGPDLVPTAAAVTPSTADAGQPVQVQITVANTGNRPSLDCFADVLLSSDTAGLVTFPWLSGIFIPALAPGAAFTATVSATVPQVLPLGRRPYHLVAQVDLTNPKVSELTKANNRLVVPYGLRLAGTDLAAVAVSVRPSDGIPRDWIYVKFDVVNAGTNPTGACSAKVYLTTETATGVENWSLTPFIAIPTLAMDGSFHHELPYQVPSVPPGNYRIRLVVDANNQLNEFDEANNTLDGGQFRVSAPDLVVLSARFVPKGYTEGEGAPDTPTSYFITMRNIGDRPSTITVTSVYLSRYPYPRTPFPGTDDFLWFSVAIGRFYPDGRDHIASGTVYVPAPPAPMPPDLLPVGYRVLVQCDALDSVIEFHEDNNVTETGRFRILQGPDLVIRRGSVTPTAGGARRAKVSVTLANRGNQPAAASKMTLYLSTDGIWQATDPVWISHIAIPAIAPGGTFDYAADFTVPAWATGAYRVIARCDATNVVAEFDKTNNEADIGVLAPVTGADRWSLYR